MKSRDSLVVVIAVVVMIGGTALRAAAQPAPAPPADPTAPLFEIYGTILPFVEYGHTTGAATGLTGANQVTAASGVNFPARFRLDMGTSNLGFRGGVKLLDALSVVWQVESGVQADGTPTGNTIASRNSQIGLTGPWGTVFAGQWDTPYKWATLALVNPIRAGFIPDYNSILNTPGFGVSAVATQSGRAAGPPDAAFDRRQGNSVQYWTPVKSGLSARIAYGLDEGRTATTAMAPSIDPRVFSGVLSFDYGPLKLRYTAEVHLDYFGMAPQGGSPGATATNRSSTDQGHKVVAQYTHAAPGFDTRVLGVFEYLHYKTKDSMMGAVNMHDRTAYYGLVEQTLLGKHHVWVVLATATDGSCELVGGDPCSTSGLGANMGVLGYLYRITKNTDLFVAGYRIANKAAASYSTFPPLGGPAAPGADVEGLGVGMLYTFSVPIIVAPRPSPAAPAPPPAPVPAPPPPTPVEPPSAATPPAPPDPAPPPPPPPQP